MSQYYTHLHPIKKKTIFTPDYTHFIYLSRSVAKHGVIDRKVGGGGKTEAIGSTLG
jgi:hypothetical protein